MRFLLSFDLIKKISDIFNNRELAFGLLIIVVVIGSIIWKQTRPQALDVAKIYFSKKILIPQVLYWIYLALVVFMFYKLRLWNISMLKDTIVWSVIAAFIIVVEALTGKDQIVYPRKLFFEIIKPIV